MPACGAAELGLALVENKYNAALSGLSRGLGLAQLTPAVPPPHQSRCGDLRSCLDAFRLPSGEERTFTSPLPDDLEAALRDAGGGAVNAATTP